MKRLKRYASLGYLLLCCLLFSQAEGMPFDKASQSPRQQDSLALVAFYEAMDGAHWKNTWNLTEPMDTWYGVHLDAIGCVRCLDLDGEPSCSITGKKGNNLRGELPDLQLPRLRYLLLANNKMSGPIPNFSGMPGMRVMRLSCNQLEGNVPDFDQLPILKSLELDYNQLSGRVPDFRELPQLESLYLLANRLSGRLPNFRHLAKLKFFIANRNQFTGRLPDFRHCEELRLLKLSDNQFNGGLPDFAHLSSLKNLDLSFNQLEGELFDWGGLIELQYLQLSDNRLDGLIPDIFMLNSLKVLDLSKNLLEGPVPDLSNLEQLTTARLQQNRLSSCPKMEHMPALKELEVSGNFLDLTAVLGNKAFYQTAMAYSPQRIDARDSSMRLERGTDVALHAHWSMAEGSNRYAWYKDGTLMEENVGNSELWLVDVDAETAGQYYCRISNSQLPGLVLIGPLLKVEVAGEETVEEDVILTAEAKPSDWFAELSRMEDKLEGEWKITGSISPNGDGDNDYFRIIGLEDQPDHHRYELLIFNVSGQLIYHSKAYRNDWAGTLQQTQQPVPDGIYYYTLLRTDTEQTAISGSVAVFR